MYRYITGIQRAKKMPLVWICILLQLAVTVSWNYTGPPEPDYFLLTRCVSGGRDQGRRGGICSSFSLPPNNRSVTLTSFEEERFHYIFVNAAKVRESRIIKICFYLPSRTHHTTDSHSVAFFNNFVCNILCIYIPTSFAFKESNSDSKNESYFNEFAYNTTVTEC